MAPRFFFLNGPATTAIYTLSLHDALPISERRRTTTATTAASCAGSRCTASRPTSSPTTTSTPSPTATRSEEHTSELQSQPNLVCRLLLEKKNHQGYYLRVLHTPGRVPPPN